MRLPKAADTWPQLLLAVRCVGGGHEVDEAAKQYVYSVLPNYFAE
jgi:hypothetical protein